MLFTRTVGVTHWKLEENSIVPASAGSEPGTGDDSEFVWSRISGEDPEFAVLMKRTTAGSSHGPSGLGTSAGGAGSGTGVPGGRSSGSRSACPRGHQHRGSCSPGSGVSSESHQPVLSAGQCPEKRKVAAPRNPDGSGPMLVNDSLGSVLHCVERLFYFTLVIIGGVFWMVIISAETWH